MDVSKCTCGRASLIGGDSRGDAERGLVGIRGEVIVWLDHTLTRPWKRRVLCNSRWFQTSREVGFLMLRTHSSQIIRIFRNRHLYFHSGTFAIRVFSTRSRRRERRVIEFVSIRLPLTLAAISVPEFADDLSEIVTELWNRVYKLEGEKFDLEREFRMKAWEVTWRVPCSQYLPPSSCIPSVYSTITRTPVCH